MKITVFPEDLVKRCVWDNYTYYVVGSEKEAEKILKENEAILHTMAEALIKYETIDSDQIDDLMEGKTPRPPSGWDDSDDDGSTSAKKKSKTKAKSSKEDDAPSSEPPAKPA